MTEPRGHEIDYAEVDRRMDHHPPRSNVTGDAHATARLVMKAAAKAVLDIIPPGREASLYMTSMEEALMWANASIARTGGPKRHVGLDELAEIRGDFGIEYGSRVDVPTDGGPITDAEGSQVRLA